MDWKDLSPGREEYSKDIDQFKMESFQHEALRFVDSPSWVVDQEVSDCEDRDHEINEWNEDLKRDEDVVDSKTDERNDLHIIITDVLILF